MIGFDLSTISSVYVGNTQYSEIYLGSTKIWPSSHDYSQDYLTLEALEAGASAGSGIPSDWTIHNIN